MKTIYYFPPASKNGYSNPYSIHYKKILQQYFNVLDNENHPSKMMSWSFLKNTFRADIFILNWLESISFLRFGFIQFLIVLIGLNIIQWRKKTIVWMFHNIHPHQGCNKYSRKIQQILFKQAKLIISHSQEAAQYAKSKTKNEVIYKCHPIMPILVNTFNGKVEASDLLIWGTVLPYKGIYEFISNTKIQKSKLRIRIIGCCSDKELCTNIKSQCNDLITFENRRIDFDELSVCIAKSHYVLFPYIGDCVSSSGALIDTIVLGGTPIGPHFGAFKDLNEEGVCFTYADYDELLNILKNNHKIKENLRIEFLKNNSWENFVKFVANQLCK